MNVIPLSKAREKGLKTYFTGKPCKHGHIALRRVNNNCTECIDMRAKEISPQKRKNNKLKCLYGISLKEYDEMWKAQNHVCAICGNTCNIKKNLSVDRSFCTRPIVTPASDISRILRIY